MAENELINEQSKNTLNVAEIIRQLENEPPLPELPAVEILSFQIDKNYQDILEKAPRARPKDIAYSLAMRFKLSVGSVFLKGSLYQRISEQVLGLKDFERFDNPDVLAPLMPQIRAELARAEQTITQKRPEAKLWEDNSWLYLEQGRRGKTAYRIYLSPKPTAIGKVFSDLATEIPRDVGYQMKTFYQPDTPQEAGRLDKIVIYCSEDNFDPILKAVGRVYENHMDDFRGRIAPGGGTVTPLEGVSITKQPTQKPGEPKITGTQEIAGRIAEKLEKELPLITRKAFQQYKTVQEAYKSVEGEFLWAAMSDAKRRLVDNLYFPHNLVSEDKKDELARAYLKTVYNATVRNYVEGKQVSISDIKTTFLQAVKARKILTDTQFNILENQSRYTYIYEDSFISNFISGAARSAGLAIAFYRKLEAKEDPSEALREILAD